MNEVNIFSAKSDGRIDVARAVGSTATAMFIYDLPPGGSSSPYHYEYEEEWLLVVDGTIVVRTPDGEHTVERGLLMARGAFPDAHPLCLGMPGMHGNYTAVTAMQKADLLVALGSRFDDRVTGKVSSFAPDAEVIHVDIDPAELGKVRRPDVPIVGDCRLVIEELVAAIRRSPATDPAPDRGRWSAATSSASRRVRPERTS